jgi:hypothetical protein
MTQQMKPRYFVWKIHEPEPSNDYKWYVVERATNNTERVLEVYDTRSSARAKCKTLNDLHQD